MIRSDSSIPDSPATFAAGAGFMEVKPLGSRRRALLMAHDEDVAQVLSWEPHAVGPGGHSSPCHSIMFNSPPHTMLATSHDAIFLLLLLLLLLLLPLLLIFVPFNCHVTEQNRARDACR